MSGTTDEMPHRRAVQRERGERRDQTVVGRDLVQVDEGVTLRVELAVAVDDPLRRTGRARSEDHGGDIVAAGVAAGAGPERRGATSDRRSPAELDAAPPTS